MALSPDGTSLYLTSYDQQGGMLVQMQRDPTTGNLYWNGCFRDSALPAGPRAGVCYPVVGIAYGYRLTVSQDGKSVYVAGSALVAFRRDPATGYLYWDGCVRVAINPLGGCFSAAVHGLETATAGVALSADNRSLHVTNNGLHSGPSSLVVFDRDPTNGYIYWAGCFRDSGALNGCTGAAGLDTADSVTVSPDDRLVYVGTEFFSGLVQFNRAR